MFLVLLQLLTTSHQAYGAENEQWQVDTWTMRDGLPQNSITDMVQTRDGYIWLTTYGGIARFDGVSFLVLHSGKTKGLDAVRFLSVVEDVDGALWFGSEGRGVFRYFNGEMNAVGGRSQIWDLALDAHDVVWAGTDEGLIRYDTDPPTSIEVGQAIRRLTPLKSGALLGSGDAGFVMCVSGDCGELPAPPIRKDGPYHWYETVNGFLVSTNHGVFEQAGTGWRDRLVQERDRPAPCMRWLGEQWCIPQKRPLRVSELSELDGLTAAVNASAISVLPDLEGGVWLGLDGGGLMRMQRHEVTRHQAESSVFSVALAPEGGLWFGTVAEVVPVAGAAEPPHKAGAFWPDGRGGILALHNNEVQRVTAQTVELVRADEAVRAECCIPVEGPWFTSNGVLYESLPGQPVVALTTAAELGGKALRPLRPARDGGLWAMLDERVLVEIVHGLVTRRIALKQTARVRDVLSRGDRVWVATYGDGLLAIEGQQVVGRLTPANGMCDYMVSHIFDTGDGDLWFNTNRGVGRVSEAVLNAAIEKGEAVTCALVNSGEGNGSSGVQGADGTLWVPTIAGLSEVNPEVVNNVEHPRLVFQEVRYGMNNLLAGTTEVFGPGNLMVRFVGLHFRNPHAVHYRYRLLGQDDQWAAISTTREVHFRNLPVGNYTFEVQSRGMGGGWSPSVSLAFSRLPLWWELRAVRLGLPVGLSFFLILALLVGLRRAQSRNEQLRVEVEERQKAEVRLVTQQQENTRVQRALEAGRRLEALGRLAGGVAHDFNNLLAIPMSVACILEDTEDTEIKEESEFLYEFVDRATALTRRLLAYGHDPRPSHTVVELGSSLEALVPMLRRLIRADIEISLDVRCACGVQIDHGRLDQVVTNLVLNSRDAIAGSGHIRISVAARADQAEIRVDDDGSGFDPELARRIFEPYFTTKALGYGTGLGLATVQGVVLDAGGTLDVESAIGVGTTVIVRFPRTEIPETPADRVSLPATRIEDLRVLVVDDQKHVLRSVVSMATSLGWKVHSANNLAEAVAVANSQDLDFLLTDIVMPAGNGPEVCAAVRSVQPDVPSLYMSGYTGGEVPEDAQVLRKPFTREELALEVQQTLRRHAVTRRQDAD